MKFSLVWSIVVLMMVSSASVSRADIVVWWEPPAYAVWNFTNQAGNRGFHMVFEFVDYDTRIDQQTGQTVDPPARGKVGPYYFDYDWWDLFKEPGGDYYMDDYRVHVAFGSYAWALGDYVVWFHTTEMDQNVNWWDAFWVEAWGGGSIYPE